MQGLTTLYVAFQGGGLRRIKEGLHTSNEGYIACLSMWNIKWKFRIVLSALVAKRESREVRNRSHSQKLLELSVSESFCYQFNSSKHDIFINRFL